MMIKNLKIAALIVLSLGFSLHVSAQETGSVYDNPESFRPKIHFSPKQDWMSDPNGLVYYAGEYHLFYQHLVKNGARGDHWGHAVSRDLVHWQHLPIALYPDSTGEVWSGSCVVDFKNTSGLGTVKNPPMVAVFTSNNGKQSQSIAYSLDKGRTWTKYKGNPVLKNPGIPDFRDPKVFWDDKSQKWVMALAGGEVIRFYSSPDLLNWTMTGDFGKGRGNHIGPWECPDLFPVKVTGTNETKWVLLVSVVDLTQGVDRLATATQYFIGDFDGKQFTSNQQDTLWFDHGKDNYAGNTFNNTPGNRRIFMGWMQSHQYGGATQQLITKTWAGAATFPREIAIVKNDNKYELQQSPVKELAQLYSNATKIGSTDIAGIYSLSSHLDGANAPLDIQLTFKNQKLPSEYGVRLKNNKGEYIEMLYDSKTHRFVVDRAHATGIKIHDRYPAVKYAAYNTHAGIIDWHLLIDVASVELFAGNGEVTFTNTVYPSAPFNELELFSKGGKVQLIKGTIRHLKTLDER